MSSSTLLLSVVGGVLLIAGAVVTYVYRVVRICQAHPRSGRTQG